MAEFDPANLPTQDGKRLVFHCGSGMRSRKVSEACLAAGMGRIAHLDGGFAGWKAAGMPYLATDPATGGVRKVPGAA
jgi:rhodanese-related sulfurtransferase